MAFLRDAPGCSRSDVRAGPSTRRTASKWGQGLRELFRGGEVICLGRSYHDQFAPDLVVTENETLVATEPEKSWRKVMGAVEFITHWTPAVERASRSRP